VLSFAKKNFLRKHEKDIIFSKVNLQFDSLKKFCKMLCEKEKIVQGVFQGLKDCIFIKNVKSLKDIEEATIRAGTGVLKKVISSVE